MGEERGIYTVVSAIMLVGLVGAAGAGIDSSNVVFRQQQLQHGTDAGALAIAADCAMGRTECSPTGNKATATDLIRRNSATATVSQPVIPTASKQVRVDAVDDVATPLWSLAGIRSRPVHASATASWGEHPLKGAPVLPLAVPYCQWLENQPGTSNTPILLRTDLVGKVMDTTNTLPLVNRVLSTLLPSLLNVTASCKEPDGQDIAQMRGPVWMTGITEVLSGVLTFIPSNCNTYVDDVNVAVGGILSSAIEPSCIARLGSSIKAGDIILLPVYVPANNLLNLGLKTQACTVLLLTTTCVTVPPKLGVKVIGYAPFQVSGWTFVGNAHADPNAPTCTQPLVTLLGQVAIGCNGLTGRFVDTVQPQANFAYSPSGADFGADKVQLIQ